MNKTNLKFFEVGKKKNFLCQSNLFFSLLCCWKNVNVGKWKKNFSILFSPAYEYQKNLCFSQPRSHVIHIWFPLIHFHFTHLMRDDLSTLPLHLIIINAFLTLVFVRVKPFLKKILQKKLNKGFYSTHQTHWLRIGVSNTLIKL